VGDTYTFINYYGVESGGFTTYDLPADEEWKPAYGAGAFSLQVTGSTAPYVTFVPGQPDLGANGFSPLLIGPIGSNYVVGASSDLKNWVQLTNLTSVSGSFFVTDPAAAGLQHRFYRVSISAE
jgi:hypothetical protein